MNPVALLVLQVTVAVKSPVQFPPQVECFLALSCSRRTCADEFPMNSTKQLHGFPPSAWKELSENSGFRSRHSPGRVPCDRIRTYSPPRIFMHHHNM